MAAIDNSGRKEVLEEQWSGIDRKSSDERLADKPATVPGGETMTEHELDKLLRDCYELLDAASEGYEFEEELLARLWDALHPPGASVDPPHIRTVNPHRPPDR